MNKIYLNNGWLFSETFQPSMKDISFDDSSMKEVRIPHTVKEIPYNYCDENAYQMESGYRKKIHIDKAWAGKHLILTFEGVAHEAEVFINGKSVMTHKTGYTAFAMDIKDYVTPGIDALITVRCDSRENLNVPPFGYVIDYMTYGGIYRDVYLEVKNEAYISDVFVTTQQAERFEDMDGHLWCKKSRVNSDVTVAGLTEETEIRQYLRRKGQEEFSPLDEKNCGDVELWDIDNPVLYELKTELLKDDELLDEKTVTFGFRKMQWKKNGFFLNGRKVKLRGLNRHQSYPYVGYAMPKSMQELDAKILKEELGVNAVRTSHYPQSHYFLSKCDELGLLVFTEFPGWQHIGDEEWKEQGVENVREMVQQYRNHPSICIWGVRINEGPDDDNFYLQTNAVAHELDPSRATGGVRNFKNSHLLEDVYTYNDFIHDGTNVGVEPKKNITSDMSKAYLVTENNGHMFPTKAFDDEIQRQEQALRHMRVLEDVAKESDIAGSFAWCMFDYNTHKDFGSGDRICYHGVLDMFRNPKLAAATYASQREGEIYLEVGSSFDIGEHPAGQLGKIFIFTNADSVRMYKNGELLKEYWPDITPYPHVPHPPIMIDDFIGDAMKEEGFTEKQEEDVKTILNYSAVHGFSHLPAGIKARAARQMALHHMTFEDAYRLYGKYVGNWGGKATTYKFEAVKDGEVVKTVLKAPVEEIHLEVETDHDYLVDDTTYDVAAVRVRVADQNGNTVPFYQGNVDLEIKDTRKETGLIEIIGPTSITMRGGMGGTYIKTTGNVKKKRGRGKAAEKASAEKTLAEEMGMATLILRTEWGEERSITWKINQK